jgi:hypothetical protein
VGSYVIVQGRLSSEYDRGGIVQGALYTRDFLERGICEEAAWSALTADTVAALKAELAAHFAAFPLSRKPNEGVTEKDLIYPVLAALGWADVLVQQQVSARRRDDIPDALLFADGSRKTAAQGEREPFRVYRHGLAIVEAKRWQRPLDRADTQGTPSSQMLRYLRRAEEASDGKLEWGILTNGRVWRLYWQGARSRAEEFLELDLPAILGLPGFTPDLLDSNVDADHWLRVFALMFGRASFVPSEEDKHSFHHRALQQTRKWEARVAAGLSGQVFGTVYPELVRALARSAAEAAGRRALAPAELDDVRRAALTLLYRVLFVLYAEDRRLLPVDHDGYAGYSLDKLRDDVAQRLDRNETLSDRITTMYDRLRNLFAAVERGDPALGLPPYNGGLFDPQDHRLLDTARLPDRMIALVVDTLSRREEGGRRLRINYRDLSVQQLGSIYERLLEYEVVADEAEFARIQPNVFARKGSGSYYTPEELVRLIVERTIGPLLAERQNAFDTALERLKSDRRAKAERVAELRQHDPAESFLKLRVCDPAMGSGHFLVTLVDVLADRTLAAMADAEARAGGVWGDDPPYRSPLQARIEGIRQRIRERAASEGWRVTESHLDDRHIVRRMILKQTIYGVDKNPMAVELSKVSLWLHTFTVGAPLSFLDHHLRCGDSLFGELVRPVEDLLQRRGSLALHKPVEDAKRAAVAMKVIEEMSDADMAEVARSETSFVELSQATQPLTILLDFFHGLRWLGKLPPQRGRQIERRRVGERARTTREIDQQIVGMLLEGAFGDPLDFLLRATQTDVEPPERTGSGSRIDPRQWKHCQEIAASALTIAARERFLHWQSAFPGVWENWESAEPGGGFDGVIGNPPWDRMKLQEVEWFATRRPEVARQQRASDRTRMIAALKKAGDPLYADYKRAAEAAECAAQVARDSGYYPKLSGGDVNIYSLFVERAHALVKPDGIVGLLVPSGIAADKSAAPFFGEISSSGRLAALLDFENRRTRFDLEPFFPDVDSRFKFCAFVTGARKRTFREAVCAFFLQSASEANDPDRCFPLTAQDFARVNPNTRTAPIFRTRRDAEIVRGIYERLPVLYDQSKRKTWPIRSFTMLHMKNDSRLFMKKAELEAKGCYPVPFGAYKRGSALFVPLYEGKMFQAYDHRAASVVVNPDNLHRPGQPSQTNERDHMDPSFAPTAQYWVSEDEVPYPAGLKYVIGYKEITSPTNARTMIAAVLGRVATNHKVISIIPHALGAGTEMRNTSTEIRNAIADYKAFVPLLLATLNSFACDFVVRQKTQGTSLSWYMVEQLPFPLMKDHLVTVGQRTVAELVHEEVLRLTYTAHDMQPFAEDLGYDGEPFPWDEEDRRHRRARLDAIYFGLYGIGEDDAAYILDTFPIVREHEEQAFDRYRTKDMILAYMRAFAAGDTESRVAI